MALDQQGKKGGGGVWKSGKGKGRHHTKGRQLEDQPWDEVRSLLTGKLLDRDLLIEHLHLIQDTYGCLSAAHLRALAEEMRLSMAEVYEVATFYAHFDVVKEGETPPPALTIRVCDSLSCELAGAQALKAALEDGLDANEVRVLRAPCMGRCDTAPVLELGHNHIDHATVTKVKEAIAADETHAHIPPYETYAAYAAEGGYAELKDLRESGDWEQVQDDVLASGLRGLGGAGFPSGKKWGFVRANAGPRYLAVNGDEGEPGTFKDRYYLERVPHLFLEGMLIAAWAVEAEKVFLYMRDEYPAVLHILATEIAALEALRRRKRDDRKHRGQARHAAPPPAVRGAGRRIWPAHIGPQHRNIALGRAYLSRRAAGLEQHGKERAHRAAQLFGVGPRGKTGRASVARRIDHHGCDRGCGWYGGRACVQSLPARRAVVGPVACVHA